MYVDKLTTIAQLESNFDSKINNFSAWEADLVAQK